jgi:hypothetical protein
MDVRWLAGEDAGDRGQRPGSVGPGVVVAFALGGEAIEVRRRLALVAVAREVVGAGRVEHDEQDVSRS